MYFSNDLFESVSQLSILFKDFLEPGATVHTPVISAFGVGMCGGLNILDAGSGTVWRSGLVGRSVILWANLLMVFR